MDQKITEAWSVVRNDDEQYTLWPSEEALPPGWREVGVRGDEAECIAHVASAWQDLRPKTLRDASA